MVRLHFILLFILTITHSFGQQSFLLRVNKILPTDKQWKNLQDQYNAIPIDRLKLIEKELDSTISATDCYKFIYNEDKTKFIAFFIMHRDNPKLKRLIHFGRIVHLHLRASLDRRDVLDARADAGRHGARWNPSARTVL